MSDSKYIVIDDGLSEKAVVFSSGLIHSDIGHRHNVVAAGFFYLGDEKKVTVYGKSSSLGGIPARVGVDENLVKRAIWGV